MEFVCTKEHLQKALKEVSGVAGRNPALPILRHVLLKTERGKLRLSATDLEVGVMTWVMGKAGEDGVTTIPLKQLSEYVTNLPSEHVHLNASKGSLLVTCGSARASFQGETPENFPLIPTVGDGVQLRVPGTSLSHALGRVMYAASADDTRPELSGVFLRGTEETLTLAATDSYRLAETQVPLPEKLSDAVRIIVPLRAAHEIQRTLEGEEMVDLTLAEGQILVRTPTTHLVSRLVDGTYPDYTQIIPAKSPVTVSVLRQELLRAVRGAGVFAYGETSSVLLEVTKDTLRVTATAQEIGETATGVPAEITGPPVSINFNHRFLIDALMSLPGERVRLSLTDPSVPALLRPEGANEPTLALIMPIKT
jgi:DNA polymerase III subunit beta